MALIAGSVASVDHLPAQVIAALVIGVDLGPNLSVTGSLATILWLVALRREGLDVGGWTFLRLGLMVMPPALIFAIATMHFVVADNRHRSDALCYANSAKQASVPCRH